MRLHFLGANRQVTGSRYCLEAAGGKWLIDCGLFQERAHLARNWETSPLPADQFEGLLLTHAHLDHCGLIPRLVDAGFEGPVFCTRPTVDLAEIILLDSAEIQEEDAAFKRRRHEEEGRRGPHPPAPLYTTDSVQRALKLFRPVNYDQWVPLASDLEVRFRDAGHILGSAMLEVRTNGSEGARTVVFSGDIGQTGKPFLRDPSFIERADYVVMESTYGDRYHAKGGDIAAALAKVINDTAARGGKVVIPTFAVERAQELMYYLSQLVHAHRIPPLKVFLDSPMAVDVTGLFSKYPDCFDQETWQRMAADQQPLEFPGLHLVRSSEQSRAINALREPCIIMAGSGMCTGGRIKHHLRQNIEREESTVLFVGYQSQGTLGRQILDRQPQVRIHNRQYRVRAQVAEIDGFSGHADRSGLLHWLGRIKAAPRQVFLTHGEEEAATALAEGIRQQFDLVVSVPEYRTSVALE